MSIEQIIVEKLRNLPPEKQQEALDFVESLLGKMPQQELSHQQQEQRFSALKLAEKWAGCLEAASDLSTNKQYLDGFVNF